MYLASVLSALPFIEKASNLMTKDRKHGTGSNCYCSHRLYHIRNRTGINIGMCIAGKNKKKADKEIRTSDQIESCLFYFFAIHFYYANHFVPEIYLPKLFHLLYTTKQLTQTAGLTAVPLAKATRCE
jgi:hypothetical protein